MEALCRTFGVPYEKMKVEEDKIWTFLNGDFSSTPDILLSKKVVYYRTGMEVQIYVVDEIEKKYATLSVFCNKADAIAQLKQSMHEAKGLEIVIAETQPIFSGYTKLDEILMLASKKN